MVLRPGPYFGGPALTLLNINFLEDSKPQFIRDLKTAVDEPP